MKIPIRNWLVSDFSFLFLYSQTGAGETYKMMEKMSSYKTSSNYTSSDDTRRSPSYPVIKHISSPGKISKKILIHLN